MGHLSAAHACSAVETLALMHLLQGTGCSSYLSPLGWLAKRSQLPQTSLIPASCGPASAEDQLQRLPEDVPPPPAAEEEEGELFFLCFTIHELESHS